MPDSSNAVMPEERHILALDGLRGMAILLVLYFHNFGRAIPPTDPWFTRFPYHIAQFGWTGVDLFFVLSGFLITRILLDTCTTVNYFRTFYARRFLRIFPIYYLVLVIDFWILPFLGHHSAFFYNQHIPYIGVGQQLWYWLFIANFHIALHPFREPLLQHYWTLSIEEQFYAFWPAIVYFCSKRRLVQICWAGIIGAFVLRQLPATLAFSATHIDFLYCFTPFRIDTLFVGALLAIYFHQKTFTAAQRRMLFRSSCAVFVLMLGGIAWLNTSDPRDCRYTFTLLAFLYASLLTACLTGTLVARVFRFYPLRIMGKYSYCIYIIEPLVWGWSDVLLSRILGQRISHIYFVMTALRVLVYLGVARLSWLLIEQPILRLKKHFPYIASPKAATQPSLENTGLPAQ